MPDPFDFNKPQLWPMWIDRFGLWQTVSEKTDREDQFKIDNLMYAMFKTGESSRLLKTFTDLTAENRKVYNTVKERFDRPFRGFRTKLSARAAFNKPYQSEGESVDSYIVVFYSLLEEEDCGYGAIREELIRDRIIVDVLDQDLSNRLQMKGDDLSLEDVIKRQTRRDSKKKKRVLKGSNTNVDDVARGKVRYQ